MMLRTCLAAALFSLWALAGVRGAEEVLVFRVKKPVPARSLDSLGFAFLADMGDAYLVQGDGNGEGKLARSRVEYSTILRTEPGSELFMLRQRGPVRDSPFRAALATVAPGAYVTAISLRDLADLDRMPYSKVRLAPGPFPEVAGPFPVLQDLPATAHPVVENLVAGVSADTLWECLSELTGRAAIATPHGHDTIRTRYSLGESFGVVTDHVAARLGRYCPDVYLHEYVIGTMAFYSAGFPDSANGFLVGNDRAVYRTRDGGSSWERRPVDAIYGSFWGVSSPDASRAWICGTGGGIYATADGGDTWPLQQAPATVTLNEICFLDTLAGWVVGDGGLILRTTDGGGKWTEVESGTASDLYGIHFLSADRGWACGGDGLTLFWDGTRWTARPSGAGEDLMDIAFADENSGWAVGHGRTVLRTSDGGMTWISQEVPEAATPFLKTVSALSPSSARVAGLNGTMLNTDDGGSTWTVRASGTLFGLTSLCFVDELKGWAVGYGSTVLQTEDGGLTWKSQKKNLPSEALIELKNVVGIKQGTRSDTQVIICGHFDSISEDPFNLAPGADDNGTGTAAVLEAARVLRDFEFERTIKFILFSGEEQGLFGSGEYAADAEMAGDLITGVLNFDMIGYADTQPEDIDLIGNDASEWLTGLAAECARIYVPGLEVKELVDPTMVLSDHASFWKAGYCGLLGIEDRDLHYPFYHTTADTLGNLDRAFMTDVVRMATATVAHLAVPDTSRPGPGGSELAVKTALPNPFKSEIEITFIPAGEGELKTSIVDVMGRRVKHLEYARIRGRGYVATWRGRNHEGENVAPGIYLVVVEQDGRRASSKIVLLR